MNLQYYFDLKRKPMRKIIKWLRNRSLLPNPLFCGNCNRNMDLVRRTERHVDGYRWRCPDCSEKRSLRTNSIFAAFPKIPLGNLLLLMYFWSQDSSRTTASRAIGVSKNVSSQVFRKFDELCSQHLERYPIPPFGGENCIVQCDESKFNLKPKYKRGRRREDVWVFGVITTEYQPARGYYEVVQRRNRETILPILNRCLKPGSVLHTDDWGAYEQVEVHLANKVAIHRVVNHSLTFVDPVTCVHTQNIESKWNQLKQNVKERRGDSRDDIRIFLDGRMWREWNGSTTEEIMANLFIAASLIFPNVPT